MSLISLYPDNANRARRLDELSNDIGLYFNELSRISEGLHKSIDEFHEKSKQMLLDLKIDPADDRLKTVDVDLGDGLSLQVIKYAADFFGFLAIQNIVSTSLLIRLAKNINTIPIKGGGAVAGNTIIRRVGANVEYAGANGVQRVAIKNLKFPAWTRFKAFAGGAGAAIVVTLAIELIVEAFSGANVRAKLREGIEGLFGPRARTRMAFLVNQELKELIDKGIGDLDTMRDLGYDEDTLMKYMDKKAKEIADFMSEKGITEFASKAKASLSKLDSDRGSFTDDDKMDKDNCTDDVCWN